MGATKWYQFLFNDKERADRKTAWDAGAEERRKAAEANPNNMEFSGLRDAIERDHDEKFLDAKKAEITAGYKAKANYAENITDEKIYDLISRDLVLEDNSFTNNQRKEAAAQQEYNADAVTVRDDSRKRQRTQRQGSIAQTRGGTILSGLDGSKLGTPGGQADGLKNILGA